MAKQGKVQLKIKLNKEDAGINEDGCSFILHDSIHKLYCDATLNITDSSGIYNEYLGFINGQKIEIEFGQDEDNIKKCPYTIIKNSTPNQLSSNVISAGGLNEITMVHHYFFTQEKKSKGYSSNISDIISDLVGSYRFESTDIEDTQNSGLWCQPMITDADFMVNQMLPFAYSSNAQNSPFYCFIDSNNIFHFKSYASLFKQSALRTYKYTQGGVMESFDKDAMLGMNFLQSSVADMKPYYNRRVFSFDKNGEYMEDEPLKITDFPSNATTIPILGDVEKTTDYIEDLDDDIELEDTKNNKRGFHTYGLKNALLPEKIIVTTALDREVCSGNVVQINVPSYDSNGDKKENATSVRYTGKYLVESSYHIWNGSKGKTMLVCGRQKVDLTSDYKMKNEIMTN